MRWKADPRTASTPERCMKVTSAGPKARSYKRKFSEQCSEPSQPRWRCARYPGVGRRGGMGVAAASARSIRRPASASPALHAPSTHAVSSIQGGYSADPNGTSCPAAQPPPCPARLRPADPRAYRCALGPHHPPRTHAASAATARHAQRSACRWLICARAITCSRRPHRRPVSWSMSTLRRQAAPQSSSQSPMQAPPLPPSPFPPLTVASGLFSTRMTRRWEPQRHARPRPQP